jgi:hypothetical protein
MGDRLRVYLETSFVSYLVGGPTSDAKIASDQAFARKWWETEREKCDCFVSEYTLEESSDGNTEAVERRLSAIQDVPVINTNAEEVNELAGKLLAGHAVPEKEVADALHIAAAAVSGMDFLLTFNCKHMANPHTLPRTRDILTSAGYVCPAIMTPKNFLENLSMEAQI